MRSNLTGLYLAIDEGGGNWTFSDTMIARTKQVGAFSRISFQAVLSNACLNATASFGATLFGENAAAGRSAFVVQPAVSTIG